MGVVAVAEEGDKAAALGFCDNPVYATVVVLYVVEERAMGCCAYLCLVRDKCDTRDTESLF